MDRYFKCHLVQLGARALLDLHALPRGHFELVGVAFVQVQHVHVGQHVRGAARLRHVVRLPDEALQERVLTCRVVPGTGHSQTVNHNFICFRNILTAVRMMLLSLTIPKYLFNLWVWS